MYRAKHILCGGLDSGLRCIHAIMYLLPSNCMLVTWHETPDTAAGIPLLWIPIVELLQGVHASAPTGPPAHVRSGMSCSLQVAAVYQLRASLISP